MATAFNGPDIGQDPPAPPPRQMQDGSDGDATAGLEKEVGEMWDGAKESARSTINKQKDTAASGMDDVAAALRDASHRREGEGNQTVARLAGSAADGLERLSGALRNKDAGAMLHDIDGFARSQPLAFFGIAFVAGFLAVRFIKAGTPAQEPA